MSGLRIWVAKKIYNHIEWHKKQAEIYQNKLQTHLNTLTADELFQFGVATGYLDMLDSGLFQKELKKKKTQLNLSKKVK